MHTRRGTLLGAMALTGWMGLGMVATTRAQWALPSPNPTPSGNFAHAVARAGDLNGNGSMDFVLGAQGESGDLPGTGLAGRVYVVDGATGGLIWNLPGPPFLGQRYGVSVDGGEDLSGDGVPDLVAGSFGARAAVYSGASGDTLFTLQHPTGLGGVAFGVEVGIVGDVSGDGLADLAVSAFDETVDSVLRAGRVHVFSGGSGTFLGSVASPLAGIGQFGIDVDGGGDANGDGRDDFIVGAYLQVVDGLNDAGRAYVFSGATFDTLFTLQSPNPVAGGDFGFRVSAAGDVNGDDREDWIVGAMQESTPAVFRAGRAYVFDGATGALLYDLESPNPDSNGFFGSNVAGIGDYDGDGFDDVLVCASHEDAQATNGSGRAYVFGGADGAWLDTFESSNPENFGRFAWSGGAGGDVNGDGRADVLVGAGVEAVNGNNDAGRAYLFPAPAPTAVGAAPSARLELVRVVPNPFNPRTSLQFHLRTASHVALTVYDARGRSVGTLFEGALEAGEHTLQWSAEGRASGTYFCVLRAGNELRRVRAVLLK